MSTMDNPGDITILHGDCRDLLPTLEAGTVNLIVTDPPYYRVKMDEGWDRQWPTSGAYLAWIGELCQEWYRVLAPNGSLYVFASPEMAARVECRIGERFEVLNRIVWRKNDGTTNGGGLWSRQCKVELRNFFPQTEYIIFAEHIGSDNHAKGEAGYEAKCDELRGFVFEPLRAYLDGERQEAGLTPEDCNEICGHRREGGMAGRKYFSSSQWCLPTAPNYTKLQSATGRFRREYEDLRREYEDLRREYEDLRREYEDLRRPFSVDDSVPYTDVWDFPTVPTRPGKHPCEKPLDLYKHVISVSSRPGDLVLDCFAGSGVAGRACLDLGRHCVLIEKDPHWASAAKIWMERPHARIPRERVHKPLPLFAGLDEGR